MIRAALLAAGMLMLAGCAGLTPPISTADVTRARERLPAGIELEATPFFPQTAYQCGPASLAMVLRAAGFAAEPGQLEHMMYLPVREGALQPELLSAARRKGALATVLPPNLEALLNELAAGRPVLVLQNLGLSWAPRWHYAVVIGVDWQGREMILRSGTTRRERMAIRTFGHTWARAGHWAIVVPPAGQLPVDAGPAAIESGLAALEKHAEPLSMMRYYEAATRRWPDRVLLRMGLGINAYAAGELVEAESAFRQAARMAPDPAAALNNLATVLQALGRLDEALQVTEQALARAGPWQAQLIATREGIRQAMQRQRP